MNGSGRQISLLILLGLLPTALLLLTIWVYGSLVEGMKVGLHQQRALAIRTLPAQGGLASQKTFAWAILKNNTFKEYPDCLKNFQDIFFSTNKQLMPR